jgi:Flp pilus assembly protein TadG
MRIRTPLPDRLRRRLGQGERGSVLVEFALVLPVLLIILFGCVDVGKAFNYWNDATHLANEASRWAVVNKDPNQISGCNGLSLQSCIQNQADTSELRSGAQVTICLPNGPGVGNPIRAKVTYTYNWMPFIAGKLGVASSAITATSTMRQEALPTNFTPDAC